MKRSPFKRLADRTLMRTFAGLVKDDHVSTATLLACLAEVDERRLYLPAGYSSMYLFLVHDLHMSEDIAFKRLRTARAGRRFPAIFYALAEGRLTLTAVVMLAPHLTQETADELLTAAEHKTNAEISLLLAERFPRPDMPTVVQAIAPEVAADELAVRPVATVDLPLAAETATPFASVASLALPVEIATRPLAPSEFRQLAVRPVATITEASPVALIAPPADWAKLAPLSPGRFAWQLTVDQETQDLLRYAQALFGHAVPSGDVATVLKRSLALMVRELERQKLAKCVRTRPRRGAPKGRYVPAEIRRTVWQRDGGQCTFVSEFGKRCESTTRLEFDHIDPVARGGQASVDRMRLRCRAHNQYEAECAFGAGFMQKKREEARRRTEEAKAQARARTGFGDAAMSSASVIEVLPWLRQLGFSAEEARRGAALCADIPNVRLDQRVRIALRGLAPNCVRRPAPVASGPA